MQSSNINPPELHCISFHFVMCVLHSHFFLIGSCNCVIFLTLTVMLGELNAYFLRAKVMDTG